MSIIPNPGDIRNSNHPLILLILILLLLISYCFNHNSINDMRYHPKGEKIDKIWWPEIDSAHKHFKR